MRVERKSRPGRGRVITLNIGECDAFQVDPDRKRPQVISRQLKEAGCTELRESLFFTARGIFSFFSLALIRKLAGAETGSGVG